jgi:hypothetical protein
MRALSSLALVALCACSFARSRTSAGGGCEVLTLIGNASPAALAADADGGLALAGESAGRRLIAGSAALEGPGTFLLRTDAGGEVSWIRGIGGVRAMALAIAGDGATLLVGQAQKQCVAAKFDSRGRELWTSRLSGDGESACRAVAVDESSGDAWAVGEFTGSLGPARSAGMSDVFVLKIAGATGEMRLLRAFGGKGADLANAVALVPPDNVIVGGTFGAYVDASVSEVNFGRGGLRASDGADGFLVGLSAEGATRWTSVVGEQGDDEVVALATHEGAVHAAANVHRERIGARCGGHVVVLRNRDWARVEEDECLSARAAAFDDASRLWVLENVGRALRARAFSPGDGAPLGSRSWSGERAAVRGVGIARIPGGFAAAAATDGELVACGKPVGNAGEQTTFVIWVRDVAP